MMTYFDIGVGAFVVLSALLGFAVGFVKGGLFLVSWLGALLVTLYTYGAAQPVARDLIEPRWLADLTAGATIFVATLIVLYLASALVGGWVRRSRLSALDRSLGLLGGIVVAAVVLSAGYIPLTYVWPDKKEPAWLRDARTRPWIELGAGLVIRLAPRDLVADPGAAARRIEGRADGAAGRAMKDLLRPPPARRPPAGGAPVYTDQMRRSMEKAVEAIR